jgi:hypothetical protein
MGRWIDHMGYIVRKANVLCHLIDPESFVHSGSLTLLTLYFAYGTSTLYTQATHHCTMLNTLHPALCKHTKHSQLAIN